MVSETKTAACIVASLGSMLHIPVAFGHDLISIAGQTGGVMASTVLSMVGVFTILTEFDVLD